MIIANPIYDVVFKYMMEDNKVAKILLSDLIKKKITHLTLKPQEYALNFEGKSLVLYRIDFKAKIQLQDGTKKVVLIELQKAKNATDIMRFRRYLGEQYSSNDNMYTHKRKKYALPIITIYFLGYCLESKINIPIVYTKNQLLDHATDSSLLCNDVFINSLTHDCIVVQIPLLKKHRRTEIETALSIFDAEKGYQISIDEKQYPAKYQPIIRKLIEAIADEELKKKMQIEDEIREILELKELTEMQIEALKQKILSEKLQVERQKLQLEQVKEQAEQEKQRAEQEKQRAEQEKQQAEQEKQRAEQEKQRAEQEKQRAEQEKQRAEQEKQRAEQEKQRAEQEKQRVIKSIQKMREMGASDREIEETLEIKLKDYDF